MHPPVRAYKRVTVTEITNEFNNVDARNMSQHIVHLILLSSALRSRCPIRVPMLISIYRLHACSGRIVN